MARTKRGQRGYSAGEKGRNRVRVFPDPKTGVYQIEWRENGQRVSKSLKHRDWEKARRQADDVAAQYVAPKPESDLEPEPLTLGQLFEMYLGEVTPTKGERSRKHDRVGLKMFLDFFKRERDPSSLSKRDWNRFINERSTGGVGPSGAGVSARTVERDLRLLLAVLNWAEDSKDSDGNVLLQRNPLRGCKPPIERNPLRVVMTEAEYEVILDVSAEVDWRFKVALVLAHETGHRIGAIRQLRWSDIDLENGLIRWRAKTEKTGYEHTTPMSADARVALELLARAQNPGIGETPVLPAPKDASRCVSRNLARDWWSKAERLAGLEPKRGRGWHSLRRKFASELMHMPLKVLCQLGGWKTERTVFECYQHADEAQMREALEARRRA